MKTVIYTFGLVLLIAIIVGGAYGAGLRIYEGSIVRAGSVTVEVPPQPGALFFDGKQEFFDPADGEVVFSKVTPGEHTVLYGAENVFPWQRDFTLLPSEDRTFKPFVSPQNASGFLITPADEEYVGIRNAFATEALPAEAGPTVSDDKTMALWVIGSTVFLEWRGDETAIPSIFCAEGGDVCNTRLLFFEADTEIKNAVFYKERNDVVLIATVTSVFAIDGLINDFRNFQPLYTGTDVDFRKKDNGELYVRDAQANGVQYLIVTY